MSLTWAGDLNLLKTAGAPHRAPPSPHCLLWASSFSSTRQSAPQPQLLNGAQAFLPASQLTLSLSQTAGMTLKGRAAVPRAIGLS